MTNSLVMTASRSDFLGSQSIAHQETDQLPFRIEQELKGLHSSWFESCSSGLSMGSRDCIQAGSSSVESPWQVTKPAFRAKYGKSAFSALIESRATDLDDNQSQKAT
jgi:hypothetical protein